MSDDTDTDELARHYADAICEGRVVDAQAVLDAARGAADPVAAISAAIGALFQRRDPTAMVAAAELGLAWCLARASEAPEAEVARETTRRAQAFAFNAAANCWPGWDDEGVVLGDEQVARGLALATRSRELVLALGLGADRVGTAHWLVGALELAAGRAASAQATFAQAGRAYESLGAGSVEALMAQGYLALARKIQADAQVASSQELAAAIERLRALGSRKGVFFADQIATADRVFSVR
jgi:hypothetical protein